MKHERSSGNDFHQLIASRTDTDLRAPSKASRIRSKYACHERASWIVQFVSNSSSPALEHQEFQLTQRTRKSTMSTRSLAALDHVALGPWYRKSGKAEDLCYGHSRYRLCLRQLLRISQYSLKCSGLAKRNSGLAKLMNWCDQLITWVYWSLDWLIDWSFEMIDAWWREIANTRGRHAVVEANATSRVVIMFCLAWHNSLHITSLQQSTSP